MTVALVAGVIISTWQAVRAVRAERLAQERYEEAEVARASEANERKEAEHRRVEAESPGDERDWRWISCRRRSCGTGSAARRS